MLIYLSIFLLVIIAFIFLYYIQKDSLKFSSEPVKIGILHSLTGTMAMSEKSVVEITLHAINEINEQGGLLGHKLEPIIADGRSDWPHFAKEAERLITQEKVSVVFGCWTSASRKSVKPIFEKYNHLLFYPVQYEGLENSKNIIYTGAAPNQQIVPAVFWAFENLGKKFFLVGSDYVFPHIANAIIKEQIASLGGTVMGEEYIPLGDSNVKKIIEKIKDSSAEVILNTINGNTNVSFFKELRKAGITPSKIPTISFSIAEQELLNFDFREMIGDYAAWNYFQSINSPRNASFLVNFKKHLSQENVVSDPMEAAYFGVHLWSLAVKEANSFEPTDILKVIGQQSFHAPEGIIYVDAPTNHTWKFSRIGKIRFDGQFTIVWDSEKQIKPQPFLPFKSQKEWEEILINLYTGWGGKWAK